jgi:oxygen-dependent protoporphyrinogen oxidase
MLAARRNPDGGLRPPSAAGRAPAGRRAPAGHARSAFLTPTTGLAEIVEALAARLAAARAAVRLNTQVARVAPAHGGYNVLLASGETLPASAVILATPAFVTAELLGRFDPEAAAALRAIPYVSTATVSVAYPLADIPRPLDGYGYLIPRAENRPILACTWTSTKFPHRAPAGYGLIRAFVGSAGREAVLDQDDDGLLALVRAELRRTLGVSAEPCLQRVFRWPRAMPQYTLGHLDRLAALERRLAKHPGLYLAGNAYRGIGLPDCIASGEQAADAAARTLKSHVSDAQLENVVGRV